MPDAQAEASMYERSIVLLEKLSQIVAANGECNVLAKRVDEFYDPEADFVADAKHKFERLSTDERARFQKQYRDRFKVAWKRLRPNTLKCKDNEAFRKVFRRIELVGSVETDAGPPPASSSEP